MPEIKGENGVTLTTKKSKALFKRICCHGFSLQHKKGSLYDHFIPLEMLRVLHAVTSKAATIPKYTAVTVLETRRAIFAKVHACVHSVHCCL